ncbi:MAG: OmpA family protein [Zoogloeaceae bacterium]|jgi:outer membrane protein OmpA-like peptidoglycan-associated protein|nr:OmpA family protein [Zoogloeaceae bacterium]
MKSCRILFVLMSVSLFAACGDEEAAPAATTEIPATAAKPKQTPEVAPAETAATFDINRIPVTNKPLGEFPFFTPPEKHKYVSNFGEIDIEEKNTKEFDRYYFVTRQDALHPIEGRTFRVELYDEQRKSWEMEDAQRIERSYEDAIIAAGGVKVFDGKADSKLTYSALDATDRSFYAPKYQGNKRQTYVIRRPDAEIWIEVSCGSSSTFTVAQKGEVKQSAGLIPASEMKDALDMEGRVALYINFDVDKAIISLESQDIVAEIAKLLESDPDLKVRVEGHTEDTGEAVHDQTLSENLASAMFNALLARGIPKTRLEYKGFGASKPVADNKTEKGKAMNRRVEIVKR